MCNVADFEIINLDSSLCVLSSLSDEELKKLYRFLNDFYFHVNSEKEISISCASLVVPEFFSKSLDEIYSLVLYAISERFASDDNL